MSNELENIDYIELGPGIFFKGALGHYQVSLYKENKEIVGWDYQEICLDPQAWFDSLKTVALAMQFGPTVASNYAIKKKERLDSPIGSINCNICGSHFVASKAHPYVLDEVLNGNSYLELQCSETCCKQRRAEVYETEMGKDFLNLWKNKFQISTETTDS